MNDPDSILPIDDIPNIDRTVAADLDTILRILILLLCLVKPCKEVFHRGEGEEICLLLGSRSA